MTLEFATWALTLTAALGSGVVGGILFAFSAFLMRALRRLPAPQGIEVMQTINVVILNPAFLAVFVGTGIAALLLAGHAVAHWADPRAGVLLAGALAYLVGVIGVTRACNIPRNDALARVDAGSEAGARLWDRYCVEWTGWNHLRVAAALTAALCFTLAT